MGILSISAIIAIAVIVIGGGIILYKQPPARNPISYILIMTAVLVILFSGFTKPQSDAFDWVQMALMFGLLAITGMYAWSTHKQANASVKMADGMARPVIDFKRDTAKIDINRQTLEVNAALTKDVSHGLSCILCNVGVGSAIDVRSFIQHPERGRLPFEFGTIESRGKTERWILSISHESNRIALVACYEDIYGRTLKSSREVSIDRENHDWKLGRLKVVPVKKDDNND